MKNIIPESRKSIVLLLLSVLLGFASGMFGSAVVYNYLAPTGYGCQCSVDVRDDGILSIPEIVKLKKTLGIKDDIQARAVYESAVPSLVSIYEKSLGTAGILSYDRDSFIGGGLVLTNDGWIITVSDVIKGRSAEDIVIAHNLGIFSVESALVDEYTGIAFLKTTGQNMRVVEIGNSNDITIGQNVLAITQRFGMHRTYVQDPRFRISETESTDRISEFIRVQDVLGEDFHGGALINSDGEVVGLVRVVDESTTEILPLGVVQSILSGVLRKQSIERPYFGVEYVSIAHAVGAREFLPQANGRGAYVLSTPKASSPAGAAGIQRGDILLEVNSEEILGAKGLSRIIQEYSVGDKVNVLILRNGSELLLDVYLGILP